MSIPTQIFERAGGWYCRWYDARSRRTRWKKLAPTRSLAQEALRTLQHELVAGPAVQYRRVTLQRYYDDHYEPDYLPGNKRWNKLQRDMIREHILPRWGTRVMSDILLYDVQSWYRGLMERYSRKYANHIVSVFKTMLHRACGRFIASSPVAMLKKAAAEKKVPDTLTREQVATLIDRLEGRDRTLVLVWIMTGLRPGEMQWLQWGDVDLDNARVVVRAKKPMARGNTRMRAGHQIKDAEDRVVDLTRNAVNLLRDHMAAPCRKPTPADFVFPNDRGELMSTMSNHIWKVFKRSGIREGSANLLRHTFASMFLSSGGNLAELKRYMGHSTITITEQHYAQYLPGNESSIHRVDFGDGGLAPEHGVSRIAGVVGQGA